MTWASRGAAAGFGIAFIATIIFSTHILEPWQELPPPPANTVDVVPGPARVPVIEGSNDSLFAYFHDSWMNIESLDDLPFWGPVTQELCNTNSEAFWLAPNSPKSTVRCVSMNEANAEANFSMMVVLDANGSIWVRSINRYASDGLISLVLMLIGPLIGLALGWSGHLVIRLRNNLNQSRT